MNEHVRPVITLNKTVAFLRVEPLYFTFHFGTFLLIPNDGSRPRRRLELLAHVRNIACPCPLVNTHLAPLPVDNVYNPVDNQLNRGFWLGIFRELSAVVDELARVLPAFLRRWN